MVRFQHCVWLLGLLNAGMIRSFYDPVANLNQISHQKSGLCLVLDRLRWQSCSWVVSWADLIAVMLMIRNRLQNPSHRKHMQKEDHSPVASVPCPVSYVDLRLSPDPATAAIYQLLTGTNTSVQCKYSHLLHHS